VPLTYVVRFGRELGIELRPHRFKKGYRASESKYGRHGHVPAKVAQTKCGMDISESSPRVSARRLLDRLAYTGSIGHPESKLGHLYLAQFPKPGVFQN
jgi:hypothetical protein